MSTSKRERSKAPEPLGVLEFSSALNGDDPLLILKKLRQFANVVRYERRLALSPTLSQTGGSGHQKDDAHDEKSVESDGGASSDDDDSYLSFDDDDTTEPSSSKRQKGNSGVITATSDDKTPSWKLDKNNYQVPFVGTSVSKGEIGSITPNVWPTGFLEVYRKHSPMGVELISNDYISAIPPGGGIHKSLCKESSEFSLTDPSGGGGKRKKTGGGSVVGGQTRGQIISMALQSNYWMALSEWILGFVSVSRLKKELSREDGHDDMTPSENITSSDNKGDKCTVPPPIMTILMKQRLPEWIAAIHNYTARQLQYTQQLQKERQQRKKKQIQKNKQQHSSKDDDHLMMKEDQQQQDLKLEKKQRLRQKRQQREEILLLTALQNLIALCHLSDGTAREVLRKLTVGGSNSSTGPAKSAKGGKFGGGSKTAGGSGAAGDGGASWMVQLFQQQQQGGDAVSSHKPQIECLRLICTLLETKDYTILCRLTEVPGWLLKQGGSGKKKTSGGANQASGGGKNFGLAYVALRHGIPRLLELGKTNAKSLGNEEEENGAFQEEVDSYAQYTARLLRYLREMILPGPVGEIVDEEGDGSSGSKKGFVLGIGATADLLSGDVLSNLTKLSLLAPPFDASAESIQAVINGNDVHENLSPIDVASIESRRLLFLLLVDTHRSPFLHGIHNTRTGQSTNTEEQSTLHLSQLSKALHGILSGQGHSLPIKMFLGICLKTTPELLPHFFRGLQLSDPKPTYRSLAALTFVEGVLREAPPPQNISLAGEHTSAIEKILPTIIPSCITKTLLGKVVQSPSALVVSSGLKLIITLLRRSHICLSSLVTATDESSNGGTAKQLKMSLSEAIMHNFPEVLLLVSIPSRFDPFERHAGNSTSRANDLVTLQLCEALQWYARIAPSLVASVKFDWAKLVPNEDQEGQAQGRMFSSAEPLLQHRILQTLLVVSRLSQTPFSSKMLPSVLAILVSTSIPEVYTAARKLALSLIQHEIFPRVSSNSVVDNNEVMQCRKYESSLWIDGISADTIQELVTMINDSKQQRVQHKIMISQAWANASMENAMPSMGASSLLSSFICRLIRLRDGSFSNKMSMLLIQIATKMLVFQADPKPLAAIVVFSSQEHIPTDKHTAGLYRAAKNILHDDQQTNESIESLASNVFVPECHLNSIVKMANNADKRSERNHLGVSHYTSPAALRQCLSVMKYSGGQNEELNTLIRKIVISTLVTGNNDSDVISRLSAMINSDSLKPTDRESAILLLLSGARSKHVGSSLKALVGRDDGMKPNSRGMEVVSELLQCTLVTAHREDTFINDLWQYCSGALQSNDTHLSGLRDFLLTILLQSVIPSEEECSPLTPGAMFDLWALVAGNLNTKLAEEFSLRLEDCLASLFTVMDGPGTWAVYQRVCSLTPLVFVDLCLSTLSKKGECGDDTAPTLLTSLLEYDCSNFSCLSSLFSGIDADAWESGRLDFLAATFVLQASEQKGANILVDSAARVIGERFLTLLSQATANVTTGVILDVLEALCSKQFIVLKMQQSMLKMFGHLESGSMVFAIDHELQMMRLSICVDSSLKNQRSNASLLLTKVFVRCCKVLPKHLKKMVRTKRDSESHSVESLIQTFSSLIENAHSFDATTVTQSSNVVDGCIVACLKYGMMDSSGSLSCSILGGCLKVVRLIMLKSRSPGSSTQLSLGSFTPSQVHVMAISHSSFQSAISRNSGVLYGNTSEFCQGLTQQLELIHLLLCTLSLDGKKVKVETETWITILSVYNASTNAVDRLLRRLMFLYEKNDCCKNEIMMNDLLWGHNRQANIDQSNNVGADENWEWFVDAIDIDRVQMTLSQFPVADTLEPAPTDDIECAEVKQDKPLRPSADSEDETDDDSSISETEVDVSSDSNVGNDLWRGAGDDLRYSPGFILPLILTTLEAHLPHEQGNNSEHVETASEVSPDDEINGKNEFEFAECQTFGRTCRRVCDRGGIALAIASLSSRCPSMRKVAVSICGLFLKALQLQESHRIKSWRERPQLEMIMSSLQRGLAVRRAIQIQRYDEQDGIELGGMMPTTRKYNIPMLPAVSAVFLAKVLIILSNPRDDMYSQMNRYFLRLTDYHGAFQDCFGLPTFLSLYCSSSDDLSRCRTERNWALLTLKDGAVDGFCYRIISQHHVPELIMSSFDSLIDQPESKSEVYLTIDVIESLIQSGGTRALNHLIERQGLLSWLHGIISWRKVSSVFPDVALRCRFLKLVTTALDSYRCSKDVGGNRLNVMSFHEKVPLANAVIRICNEGADTVGSGIDSTEKSPTAMLAMTCNALWAIHLVDEESTITHTSQGSTELRDSTSLLMKFVHHEKMYGKVLAVLCELPLVSNETDICIAKLFCNMALGFILKMRMQLPPETILASLKRAHELFKLHPCLGDDANIISNIMKCRHLAVLAGGLDVWNRFLSYLEKVA